MAKVRGPHAEGGPLPLPSIPELAARGREFRGEKPLRQALKDVLRDLFDAYLYTLTHPCEVSPYEVLALINTHREALDAHFETLWGEETLPKRRKGA